MNWWEILQIPYDSDLKTIKKAYAKLLKIYNPEDDPEGYQRLREAYDEAIKSVKNNNKKESFINDFVETINEETSKIKNNINTYENEEQNNFYDINSNNNTLLSSYNVEQKHYSNDINQKIEEFYDNINEIYNDDYLRKDNKVWEELLNRDIVWNVYSSSIIENYIFQFLLNHKDLPLNIWCIFNHYFNWTQKERFIYEKYGGETVEEAFKILQNLTKVKYEYIKQINPDYIEKYILLRNQAYEALKKRDYYVGQECLLSAYEIFKYDAELLKLIGDFYYKVGDFDKSLDFLKQAFEIDKVDLKVACYIGHILAVKRCYAEALPYLELYLSSNIDDEMALNNIGYCYYFTNNFLKSKESFLRLLKFQPKNIGAKKYLRNIEAKLDGKNVKTLKLKDYKPRKKKIVKKKEKKQKTEASMKTARIKSIIILLILTSIVLKFTFIDKIPANNKTEKITEEQGKNVKQNIIYDEDETVFKNIKTIEDLSKENYYINLRIYLNEVKPTDYYKVSEAFQGKTILSKTEIESNNLQDKIESRIFIGIFDNGIVLFADKNYKEDATNKNNIYKIQGAMCPIDMEIFENIRTQFKSHNESDKTWRIGIYVDCSTKEVERLKKHNESMETHGGKRIKVVKTFQQFNESEYDALHSIYLKNIIPLNMYVNVDEKGKFDFRKKEELNEINSKDKTYTKAYVGEIDGKNVMFIDSKFSMDKADSNGGYTVEGYKYKFTVTDEINLPAEKGQNVNLIRIEPCFIYNTNLKVGT